MEQIVLPTGPHLMHACHTDMPPDGEPDLSIHVCREGVFWPGGDGLARGLQGHDEVDAQRGVLQPRCRFRDRLDAQPPLAFRLQADERQYLNQADEVGVRAATVFGPPQEKSCNQDFALAAHITIPERHHVFAAVADGVTTRTFWPERSSRLACFAALRTCVSHVRDGHGLETEDVERLRDALVATLTRTLQEDHDVLLRSGVPPADWDPDLYRRRRDGLEFWYASTLIIALAGPDAAMVLWAGDGAVRLEKRFADGERRVTWPLLSTEDMEVNNVVSLGGPMAFSGGRIDASDLESLTITLLTDGVDRTLRRLPTPPPLETAPDSRSLAEILSQLSSQPECETDNLSAAVLNWPIRDRV